MGGCGGRSWPRSGRGRAAPHDGTHGNRVDGTADAVVTLCEGMRGHLITRGNPDEKIVVAPNAVDPGMLREGAGEGSGAAGSAGLTDALVLGFLGSFHPYEGMELLFQALPAIRLQAGCRGAVGGGGPAEQAWRQAAGARVAPHVRFAGRVPHDDVPRYFDLIDMVVSAAAYAADGACDAAEATRGNGDGTAGRRV